MAVSQIEEKILGRLAEETATPNALLSASLYQVLGLSILLSRKLYRARKLRKLDNTRDTKSLQLYHHIIWLAREGLSITEVYILPYCQNGEQGPECRVMAAKLRASLYHVFCLFHNHPPISQIKPRSPESGSPSSSTKTGKGMTSGSERSPPKAGDEAGDSRRRSGRATLRDAIPSMVSEASYVTNPYAPGQTPPPGVFLPATDARRTPTRPPGLPPIHIAASQAAATFLLPPLNFLPMVREHFTTAQHLASSLLSPTHALRLSVALEHAAFLWDCAKEHERARKLARRAVREVYSSSDGLDDEEFADASALVQALGGIVKRGSNESTPVKPENDPAPDPVAPKSVHRVPRKPVPPPSSQKPKQNNIDRTISVSPEANRRKGTRTAMQPQQIPVRVSIRSPERLSTVPEVGESTDEAARSVTHATFSAPVSRQGTVSPPTSRQPTVSPPISRLSSRTSRREHRSERASSAASASDKATKRRIVEQAEQDLIRRQSQSNRSNASGSYSTDSKARRKKSSEKRGNEAGSSQQEVRRIGSGSNASGGSQPHSRQTTPPEGLSTKRSRGSDQSKRARRKEARQKAAASVVADEIPTIQKETSSLGRHHSLPPTPPPTVPPPTRNSPTRPLPSSPHDSRTDTAYRRDGQTQISLSRPLPPVPNKQAAAPANEYRRSPEKRTSVPPSYMRYPQQAAQQPIPRPTREAPPRQTTSSQRRSPPIDERRDAIIRTLEIVSAVSRGFATTRHRNDRAAGMRVV